MDSVRSLRPNEYTAQDLVDEYGGFTDDQIELLMGLPTIFGYEDILNKHAKLGRITRILKTTHQVELHYRFIDYPPIPNDVLRTLQFELNIEENEFHRTHWALKEGNLKIALVREGFPSIPFHHRPLVNVRDHQFEVALSFPGQARPYIEIVANLLTDSLGDNAVFYDDFYKSQLASPSLDSILQSIYGERSKLIVVFLSVDYAEKRWCGIEFRSIRTIIHNSEYERIMFVRLDDNEIEGVFNHDGYIDARTHSERELATLILERVKLLN